MPSAFNVANTLFYRALDQREMERQRADQAAAIRSQGLREMDDYRDKEHARQLDLARTEGALAKAKGQEDPALGYTGEASRYAQIGADTQQAAMDEAQRAAEAKRMLEMLKGQQQMSLEDLKGRYGLERQRMGDLGDIDNTVIGKEYDLLREGIRNKGRRESAKAQADSLVSMLRAIDAGAKSLQDEAKTFEKRRTDVMDQNPQQTAEMAAKAGAAYKKVRLIQAAVASRKMSAEDGYEAMREVMDEMGATQQPQGAQAGEVDLESDDFWR